MSIYRKHFAIEAEVKYPNTWRSDLQPKVWHIVTVKLIHEHGHEEIITIPYFAADPCEAIREINRMAFDAVISSKEKG